MKTLRLAVLVGVSLTGMMDVATAQRGGQDYGYEDDHFQGRDDSDDDDDQSVERRRGDDGGRNDRRWRDDDADPGRKRDRRYREEPHADFDEDEYLRCHPDVRRAVERGEMKSGKFHYRQFGRREGRRLTCVMKI
ncbi:MAG: hypothetical protein K2Y56_07475 [Methylobacterium sp.]|uniref:hypothetical protein n=1 Tax=Methylobacterium sp. TaxID=409 RepID=UPI0025EDB47D|nr:hypothetical protein [Methylobacterium sp.]MBX9931364.1 hypothetical protein [Methylobacterium sp.]